MTASLGLPETARVLAQARWPGTDASDLPAVAGFVTSGFSPLVAAVTELCLTGHWGEPPALPACGDATAVVLASATGDLVTTAAIGEAVSAGRRVPPLLFYQSNLNAVAGYVAARWGLRGPVVATMPGTARRTGGAGVPGSAGGAGALRAAMAEAMTSVALLLESGDALAALAIAANCYLDGSIEGQAQLVGPASWAPSDIAGH